MWEKLIPSFENEGICMVRQRTRVTTAVHAVLMKWNEAVR